MRTSLFHHYNSLLFILFLIVVFSSSSVLASSQLSSVTKESTQKYYPGKVVWHDLLTPELEKSKQFYAQLFGWTFKEQANHVIIYNQGKKIGGIVEIKSKLKKKGKTKDEAIWLASLSVEDIDKAVSAVKSHGGQILQGPVTVDNHGQGILVSDPQGAHVVLLNTTDGDAIDDEAKIGGWLWNEVWTHNMDKTIAFYSALAPYTATDYGQGYEVLQSQENWRVGVRETVTKRGKYKNEPVRWVSTIRVSDVNALLNKVKALGGKIVLYPGEYPSDTNTALIIDNAGALLMIQSWDFKVIEGVKAL
jgi:predicted enzyme related to lactoylglutathione lyase